MSRGFRINMKCFPFFINSSVKPGSLCFAICCIIIIIIIIIINTKWNLFIKISPIGESKIYIVGPLPNNLSFWKRRSLTWRQSSGFAGFKSSHLHLFPLCCLCTECILVWFVSPRARVGVAPHMMGCVGESVTYIVSPLANSLSFLHEMVSNTAWCRHLNPSIIS